MVLAGVGLGTGRKTEMDVAGGGLGAGAGLKSEMDSFKRSSMERKADGILRSDSSSDIKIR
jgi:hypothetical protein